MDLEKFYLDISDRCFSLGLEEFEEKMDTLGESKEKESSWLGSILQGVLSEADLDEDVDEEERDVEKESEKTRKEEDVDYVEPPFLDTRLGGLESSQALIRRRRSTTTHARQGKQKKSQGEEVVEEDKTFEGEEERSCTVELWRCLARAFEPTVRQAEKDGSIAR